MLLWVVFLCKKTIYLCILISGETDTTRIWKAEFDLTPDNYITHQNTDNLESSFLFFLKKKLFSSGKPRILFQSLSVSFLYTLFRDKYGSCKKCTLYPIQKNWHVFFKVNTKSLKKSENKWRDIIYLCISYLIQWYL